MIHLLFVNIGYLILFILFTGCTSALKKQCNETNWFNYGEQVAMSGKRLTGDHFVKSCELEKARVDHSALDVGFKKGMSRYCEPETVFQTGRSGEFFSEDMCDGGNQNKLKARHAEGVHEYCLKENGYNAGTKGKAYNQICPKELERNFLSEFNRGRKAYLTGFVSSKEDELRDLERDISNLQSKKSLTQHEITRLSGRKVLVTKAITNAQTGVVTHQSEWVVDPDAQSRASSLQWDMHLMDSRLQTMQHKLEVSREELRKAKIELSIL